MQESRSLERRESSALSAREVDFDALAARVALGDKVAFEVIYNALVDDLYNYARGQCRDANAAEDVVANVFLNAWRSAHTFRPGHQRYRRWLFTIARNEIRDYWRTLPDTLPLVGPEPVDSTYESEPERAPEPRWLTEALAALTIDQREVVVLRYFNDKTNDEIAAIMGKRAGAIRALHTRALGRIRKVMQNASP